MLRIGKYQNLKIAKKVDFGVYLVPDDVDVAHMTDKDRVLLPKNQLEGDEKIGDMKRVFLYKDSKDRLIATSKKPKLVLGEIAPLEVVSVEKIGAFLDWGLEKDLFLPFKEQERKVKKGDIVLVRLYLDKSKRLCASMKGLYDYLSQNAPYSVGDDVSGRVYEFSDNFGTFVAIDDKYSAMLPKHESVAGIKIGDLINARVTNIKEDGKLDISIRDKAYLQIDDDAKTVMAVIDEYAGVLPFNDKAPADVIMREIGLSKNAFKRAVGRLYKERKIEITEKNIKKVHL